MGKVITHVATHVIMRVPNIINMTHEKGPMVHGCTKSFYKA